MYFLWFSRVSCFRGGIFGSVVAIGRGMQEQPQRPDIPRPPDVIDSPPPDIKPIPPPDIPPPAGPPDLQPPIAPERSEGPPAM